MKCWSWVAHCWPYSAASGGAADPLTVKTIPLQVNLLLFGLPREYLQSIQYCYLNVVGFI